MGGDDLEALARAHGRTAATWLGGSLADGDARTILPDAAGVAPPAAVAADRYEDRGLIGLGGMGEVRRVYDRVLLRTLAMKVIRADLAGDPRAVARFVEEARVGAQLQHAGTVPVHDLGQLPDRRWYFTQKEIVGRDLGAVIAEAHRGSPEGQRAGTGEGFLAALHRLAEIVLRVCEAVGYAHARGVVHRDLKPENIMVGDYGEVLVLDWGLARVDGAADDAVASDRRDLDARRTRHGSVAGTAFYMAPEQARGEVDRVGPRSDVYGLGATLYEALSGLRPYHDSTFGEFLSQVVDRPPEDVVVTFERASALRGDPHPIALPDDLVAVVRRAMARDPADRHPDGAAIAAEIRAFTEGSRRRQRALQFAAEADRRVADARDLSARAATLRAEGDALLAGVPLHADAAAKAAGWARQDEAHGLEAAAARELLDGEALLHAALSHEPALVEAHLGLLEPALARHAHAERARDPDAAAREERAITRHADALPDRHPARLRARQYLDGDGTLTLAADPVGAIATLWRYVVEHRRLVPRLERVLGPVPLRHVRLARGSWLVTLDAPGRVTLRVPVFVDRCGAHLDVAPGESDPLVHVLQRPGELGGLDVAVPGGWFRFGGDPVVGASGDLRRVWADPFVIERHPVTNRRYLAFLDDLVATGRADEAWEHVPKERGGAAGESGSPLYGFADGRFHVRADGDGHTWDLDWPVVMVDWDGATAFAAWQAETTGLPWRLPDECEREKAARGVDGRFYPWGDVFDPSFCSNRDAYAGPILPARVEAFALDESPYGVRGLAGNVQDWTSTPWTPTGPVDDGGRVHPTERPGAYYVRRGGCWNTGVNTARSTYRLSDVPKSRSGALGVRLVRSL